MEDYRRRNGYYSEGSSALMPEERERVNENRGKKRRERVLPRAAVDLIPAQYVLMVAAAGICAVLLACTYIHGKTETTALAKEVATLQNTLEDKKQENQILNNEIATCTSIETIYEKAINQLGMMPADESQVRYYESSDSEYVVQKEDIPNE